MYRDEIVSGKRIQVISRRQEECRMNKECGDDRGVDISTSSVIFPLK